jgi:hypothetical protein
MPPNCSENAHKQTRVSSMLPRTSSRKRAMSTQRRLATTGLGPDPRTGRLRRLKTEGRRMSTVLSPWADEVGALRQSGTATSPDSRQPAHRASRNDGQLPNAPLARDEEATRARCVPDRPVNAGSSRSLPDSPVHRLTCVQAGCPAAQTDLLSSGSSCGAALELRLLALPVGVGLLAAESLVDSPSFSMWQHLGRPRYRGQARSRVRFASLNVTATARGQNPQGCREGAGNRRSIACSVNQLVNWTLRDSSRRGRRSRRSER